MPTATHPCTECNVGPQVLKNHWVLMFKCPICKKHTFCYVLRADAKKEWNDLNKDASKVTGRINSLR